MNEWDFSSQVVIYIEYVLSCLALGIVIEKAIVLFLLQKPWGPMEALLRAIERERTHLKLGGLVQDLDRLRTRHPALDFSARILGGEHLELARQRTLSRLNRRVALLGSISTVAPMLGLLGTVTGMIKSFRAFDQTSVETLQLIAGIDEALYTTALGLFIAIPGMLAYNWLAARTHAFADEIDLIARSLQEP